MVAFTVMQGHNNFSTKHVMIVWPQFSIDNGQRCKKGGLIIQQDNDIKDMIAANNVAKKSSLIS